MSLLAQLFKAIEHSVKGKRSWTPNEIRELIERKELTQALKAVESLSPHTRNHEATQHCLRGEILFHQRLDDEARAAFQAALRIAPGMAEGHYGLSLVLAEQNKFDAAVRHALFAVDSQPDSRYLAQLGYCNLQLGNYQVAEKHLRLSTSLSMNIPNAWNNLGIVLLKKGDLIGARESFKKALAQNPFMEAARLHMEQLEVYEKHLTDNNTIHANENSYLSPEEIRKEIDLHENKLLHNHDESTPIKLAKLYTEIGDLDSGIEVLQSHLSKTADCSKALGELGVLHYKIKDYTNAELLLKKSLAEHQDNLDYIICLVKTLFELHRYEETAQLLDQALSFNPENIQVLFHLATSLTNRCLYQEALQTIKKLQTNGQSHPYHAAVLRCLGRFDEALAELNVQLANQPNNPSFRLQRAVLNLALENFDVGWDDYNYRNLNLNTKFRMLPFPIWNVQPLEGKKIIVLAEQGLGDQIMFASCIPDLLQLKPASVVIEANARVAKTLSRSFPSVQILPSLLEPNMTWANQFPDIDYFVPLADLPCRFRRCISAFPAHSGYIIADPTRVEHWRSILESCGHGPYFGLSWRGGTEQTSKVIRSFTPQTFLPLSSNIEATWVCLQYGDVQDEVLAMNTTTMPLQYWKEAISDLDEFAALICALDGVVTACNTTVHIAGALGKPVWVLAPRIPEWRYGLRNIQLPWYPSSHIIRQSHDHNWTEPINKVKEKLIHFLLEKNNPN